MGDCHIVVALCNVVSEPIRRHGPADDTDLVLFFAKQNGVADDLTLIVAHNVLFGLQGTKAIERVDPKVGEKPDNVRPLKNTSVM